MKLMENNGLEELTLLLMQQSFRVACTYGHLSICQWLQSLGDVDIHNVHFFS
jgi:hypothetical protein